MSSKILIVDDDEDILIAGRLLLKRHFDKIVTTNVPSQIPTLLASHTFDAILLDMNFSPGLSDGNQGFHCLEEILNIDPDAVVILITAHGDVDMAVEAMKRGATDFITKPWQNQKVIATLSTAVKLKKSRNETSHLKQVNATLNNVQNKSDSPILGDSATTQNMLSLIDRVAPTDANVLILGENGTGKELTAQKIHSSSLRNHKIFISVDMGTIPENLFESELFGHKKGAFTGANENKIGFFEAANGGTIFLDEIGNVPLHLQSKLLTALEKRVITPVGDTKEKDIDVRVIAATNLPKMELLDERKFRQDLLFRLNTVEIIVPPLRERPSDIPAIAAFYADFYAKKYNFQPKSFSEKAIKAIKAAPWPGNVRALRHSIERAVILSDSTEFQAADFQLSTEGQAFEHAHAVENNQQTETLNLNELEKNAITLALKRQRYNISHAAKELGLTRAALYRRMEKHGL